MALVAGSALAERVGGTHGSIHFMSAARAETVTREISFNIPSQPLAAALDAYGAVTRTQVLYVTALASGRRSGEVRGVYTADAALRLLLSGTDLAFDYTAERAITLVPARLSDLKMRAEAEERRRIADFDHFLGGIQAGVLAALCRDPEARPGGYRIAMRFYITGAGAVTHATLLGSTGKPARDAAIVQALARLSFSEAPPPTMPQPVTMLMAAASPGAADGCAEAQKD